MKRRTFIAGLAAASTFPGLGRPARAQGDPARRIADFVKRACEHWQTPGAAVAVIHGGKRLMAAGFGLKNSVSGGAVDEHTAFAIGSCSKAYTACAAALLVEERRIGWDDPVMKILGGIRLYDPQITAAVTLRDLLSHRVGLSRAFVGEYGSDLTRAEILARAHMAGRHAGFREQYCYSNLGYCIVAEAVGRLAGASFERHVETRILAPLGMKNSTAGAWDPKARGNLADPHRTTDSRLAPMPHMPLDNTVGPGSIYSSAHDTAAWLEFQLGAKGPVSAEGVREMHTAQVTEPRGYGLGWEIGAFKGQPFVGHTGSLRGFSCRTRVDPGAGYAAFCAANAESPAAEAIVAHIGSVLGRNPARDWIAVFDAIREKSHAESAVKLEEERKSDPLAKSSLPLAAFAGTWQHPGLGTLTLTERDGALRFALQHVSFYDGWLVRYGGSHFSHQTDGYRESKDPRPVTPGDRRFRFDTEGGRVVAAEWLDAWFGGARFTRS